MVKTDQVSLSAVERGALSAQVHGFMDSMRATCIAFAVSFIVIVFFIAGPFRPDSRLVTFLIRCAVSLILIYGIYTNGQAIAELYTINGIFSLNSMSDIRANLYTCIVFTLLMLGLVALLMYKQFG